MRTLQPLCWLWPTGYSNGVVSRPSIGFLAGIVRWSADEAFEADDFVGQARQSLANIVALLDEAGAKAEHIVCISWFVGNKKE